MADQVRPDAAEIKERYMKSPHIGWQKFCESEGLPYHYRNSYPVSDWVQEKKKAFVEKEGESLSSILFDHRFEWHKDVVKTLKEYPKLGDMITAQIARKMQYIAKLSDEDFNKGKKQVKDKDGNVTQETVKPVSPMDLHMMALAYKSATEAKHKSLLIATWSVKDAEDDSKPDERQVDELTKGFHMKIIGKGEVSAQDIENIMSEYLDKPPKEQDGD